MVKASYLIDPISRKQRQAMPFVGKTGSHSSYLKPSLLHQLMSSTRLQPHHSLPAPVVHATFSTQSKSHVLAGVQDAYWSDDEAVWGLILFSR